MTDKTKGYDFHDEHHTDLLTVNMGPSHPATHGTVKFLISLDGETIEKLDVEVGYLHRGFEKECEAQAWNGVFPYTDRLDYTASVLNNVGYALAVEKTYRDRDTGEVPVYPNDHERNGPNVWPLHKPCGGSLGAWRVDGVYLFRRGA